MLIILLVILLLLSVGSFPVLAVQPRVGLLPLRWSRLDRAHSGHSVAARSYLKICRTSMRQASPRPRTATFCITLMVCVLAVAPLCAGYSVLTHEEIIDLLWKQQIQPLLLARFPNATPQDLVTAHAYAYGGSVVQDIGYYPFGSHVFSDLTHYVRTGDFVQAMLNDAQDLNEYAFRPGCALPLHFRHQRTSLHQFVGWH